MTFANSSIARQELLCTAGKHISAYYFDFFKLGCHSASPHLLTRNHTSDWQFFDRQVHLPCKFRCSSSIKPITFSAEHREQGARERVAVKKND